MLNKPFMNGKEYLEKLKKEKEECVNKQICYINSELENGLKKASNGIISLGPFNMISEVKKIYEEAGYKFIRKKCGINDYEILIMPLGVDYNEN